MGVVVEVATEADIEAWLAFVLPLEPLFGPMAECEEYVDALTKSVERGTAYCVRERSGCEGGALVAGMLLALKPGICRIGWMGVSATCRRRGIGTALVNHAAALVERPGEIRVTTFGPDNPMGGITRDFYRKRGFQPREMKPGGPNGYSKQQFYKKLRQ